MAVIKCKMCGGELNLVEGASTAECEYCGSVQTVPKVDDEKKLTLFARANRLRSACEFDKAAGVYENIIGDFPEEAEAYWGLVLCKYGIEYVDDPATGKKIPTCHRSSFDSVMEDSNFERAQECADLLAQRIYREEAKQFERIRKAILEVSSAEKPYDIFICYKESDENGDRTLDSVLAQDLYSALTEKGYRVFFSRITLQGKLGEAYEPYIFAALNSAKVMLAVGTCYEYYNAVWVKNEWSRYLKLCVTDKDKHLIPCYKNLDPEDMPKEFNHLQGADLGKMGAVQDILFNMEKYIPRKKETTVIQERVVAGGSGDNKIASLLDRGNMALEDGDWEKADGFFEEVLNNDSKNAQAYLGKTLAQTKYRSLDAFIGWRKSCSMHVTENCLTLKPNHGYISRMAAKFCVPGFVEDSQIRKLYDFDLTYTSNVQGYTQRYSEEKNYWDNHKWLSKAEKFAANALAESLNAEKTAFFAWINQKIDQAKKEDEKKIQQLQEAYDAHLKQADEAAQKRYDQAVKDREVQYGSLVSAAKHTTDLDRLIAIEKSLIRLGDFRESKDMVQYCRNRINEEQARQKEEKERRDRMLAEEMQALQQARKKKLIIISSVVATCAGVALLAWLIFSVIIPGTKYSEACRVLESGQYREAILLFEAMDGYGDSAAKIKEARAALEQQEKNLEMQKKYEAAQQLEEEGKTLQAAIAFGKLAGFEDATQRSLNLWNTREHTTFGAGNAHIVALKNTGEVVATGVNDHGRCKVSSWKGIVQVAVANGQTFGLCMDGTVKAVGYNEYNQCDVSDWEDVVAVYAGKFHTAGLRVDGTVVATGYNEEKQCDVGSWKDIVQVSVSDNHTVGLKSDGSVVAVGNNDAGQCDVSAWTDIVKVYASTYNTVGLKADGTVVAVGDNQLGQCDVSDWTDIVDVSASSGQTVGLKSNGTVVAVGNNEYGQCNVSTWTNIVAISSCNGHVVGLRKNGEVLSVGYNESNQCATSLWRNVASVLAVGYGTVGLRENGTMIAAGCFEETEYKCDLSLLTDIKLPN